MGAVALVLMAISLLACLAPALRASKIDPVISLRAK
jgi:ABC-type lipoprotein release transport system permease subunit